MISNKWQLCFLIKKVCGIFNAATDANAATVKLSIFSLQFLPCSQVVVKKLWDIQDIKTCCSQYKDLPGDQHAQVMMVMSATACSKGGHSAVRANPYCVLVCLCFHLGKSGRRAVFWSSGPSSLREVTGAVCFLLCACLHTFSTTNVISLIGKNVILVTPEAGF